MSSNVNNQTDWSPCKQMLRREGYLEERQNRDPNVVEVEPPRVHPYPRGVEPGPGAALGRTWDVHLGYMDLGAEDAGAVLSRGYGVIVAGGKSAIRVTLYLISGV